MAKIIKVYKQEVKALRFIGKKYEEEDRLNGSFSHKWNEFFENNWFKILEDLVKGDTKLTCEDGDAYIGLMRWKEEEPFQYWIGMFLPENTLVPKDFDFIDFEFNNLGICFVYGKENEVYGMEEECLTKLNAEGYKIIADNNKANWFFERYACPRFTTPDEKGNIILDICYFIE